MNEIPRTAAGRPYNPEGVGAGVPPRAAKDSPTNGALPRGLQEAGFPREHPSGLEPLGRAILCEPYAPERTRAQGLVIIPQHVLDNEQALDVKVRVVAAGPLAWTDEPQPRARVGDVVLVARMSGHFATGMDNKPYRFVNDRDVFGKVREVNHG